MDPPMRILYLADIRFPLERANGIQSMETCHALARRGHTVTLIVRPDTHAPPRDPYDFYGLPRIAALRIELAPTAPAAAARRAAYVSYAIGRAVGHARQDVIFTRDLGLAALLVRLPRSMRTPVVYEGHGIAAEVAAALPSMLATAPTASPSKLRRLERRDARVWRDADGYVTITAGLATELTRRYGSREHVVVIPDGVRLSTTAPGPSVASTDADGEPHRYIIGYAGHLYPWKGVDFIIEAVTALQDTQALIIGGHEGEPDLQRLRDFAVSIDCASRVTFTGALPPTEVAAKLQEADALVLPNPASAISTRFTSPLKLFEYMAAAKPIVASDLPSIREVLRDGRNALLVPAGNPAALTAAIRRLKDDPALSATLASQARADVVEFTWDRRAERLERLFLELAP
jgi:glycosyltransferase involved in cell wall biosynthesis